MLTLLNPPQIQLFLKNFPTWSSAHCIITSQRNSLLLCIHISCLGDWVISLSVRWFTYQYSVLFDACPVMYSVERMVRRWKKKYSVAFLTHCPVTRLPYVGRCSPLQYAELVLGGPDNILSEVWLVSTSVINRVS